MTRKHKEDVLVSTTAKVTTFLNEQWKWIVSAVAVVVIIVGAMLLYGNYATGRNEGAASRFNEAKALYDEAVIALGTEGEAETATEKFESARTKFQEVHQKGGHKDTISKAWFYAAKCSYQLGRYDEAIAAFQTFADKHPKSIPAFQVQKVIANCYEQLGGDENLAKAIQQYDAVLKSAETHATLEAYLDKGRCHEKLGEWNQAISTYEIITSRFKQNVELAIQGKSKDFIEAARDVIAKYETLLGGGEAGADQAKFIAEAQAFEGKDQWFEALKSYDKAIFTQKQYWSEKALGDYSREMQNASDALGKYVVATNDVIKFIISGRKLEEQGDWDEALRYYKRAATFDFLPGIDLFEKAQFRIYWINSVENFSQSSS